MKISIAISILVMALIIACTMDDIKKENDRVYKRDLVTTIALLGIMNPVGECDPESRKENCNGKYLQVCNGRGEWENYNLCKTSCTVIPNQDVVECVN